MEIKPLRVERVELGGSPREDLMHLKHSVPSYHSVMEVGR
jgi:hypothetical protein